VRSGAGCHPTGWDRRRGCLRSHALDLHRLVANRFGSPRRPGWTSAPHPNSHSRGRDFVATVSSGRSVGAGTSASTELASLLTGSPCSFRHGAAGSPLWAGTRGGARAPRGARQPRRRRAQRQGEPFPFLRVLTVLLGSFRERRESPKQHDFSGFSRLSAFGHSNLPKLDVAGSIPVARSR